MSWTNSPSISAREVRNHLVQRASTILCVAWNHGKRSILKGDEHKSLLRMTLIDSGDAFKRDLYVLAAFMLGYVASLVSSGPLIVGFTGGYVMSTVKHFKKYIGAICRVAWCWLPFLKMLCMLIISEFVEFMVGFNCCIPWVVLYMASVYMAWSPPQLIVICSGCIMHTTGYIPKLS